MYQYLRVDDINTKIAAIADRLINHPYCITAVKVQGIHGWAFSFQLLAAQVKSDDVEPVGLSILAAGSYKQFLMCLIHQDLILSATRTVRLPQKHFRAFVMRGGDGTQTKPTKEEVIELLRLHEAPLLQLSKQRKQRHQTAVPTILMKKKVPAAAPKLPTKNSTIADTLAWLLQEQVQQQPNMDPAPLLLQVHGNASPSSSSGSNSSAVDLEMVGSTRQVCTELAHTPEEGHVLCMRHFLTEAQLCIVLPADTARHCQRSH